MTKRQPEVTLFAAFTLRVVLPRGDPADGADNRTARCVGDDSNLAIHHTLTETAPAPSPFGTAAFSAV